MYTVSVTHQKALERAQQYFKRANSHPSTIQWRKDFQENQAFFDGMDNGQWTPETLAVLQEREQMPITVNFCKSIINRLSGEEIQSRYRMACRNDSGRLKDDKLALAQTHRLYHIQTKQNMPRKGSLKFRDMHIGGIGWSNQYKEYGKCYYEWVNPINVIPDPDNLDPQYEGMQYVCRQRFLSPDWVKSHYPKIKKYIDFEESDCPEGVESPELFDRISGYTDSNNYSGNMQSRLRVIEVQYRTQDTAYCGIASNGDYFETFDEEKAEKLVDSISDIEEKNAERIMRTLFLDDFLLEHAPLRPDLPNLESFSYIPVVWERRFATGVPYGILESIKDIQRDCNVRITKSMYLLNSSRLVASGNIQPGKRTEDLRKELKRPDSLVIFPEGTVFQIESNAELGEKQMQTVKEYIQLAQRITGVNDEMLGIQTNATSAIAQNIRQINSVRNNVFAFDNFANMKEREARFFLDLLQDGDEENILVQILTEEDREAIILNLVRERDGKKVILNDVRTLPLSLYIEEVPDYRSSFEEQREMLKVLLGNSNANWMMLAPGLLKMLGIRDAEKISKEMKIAMREKMMMEQGIMNNGDANPNAPQDSAIPESIMNGAGLSPVNQAQQLMH
jgi:hypothetical protein